MGLAVVFLTIILRIILLPLTIFSQKSRYFYDELKVKIQDIQTDFPNDIVKQKEEVKEILRKNRLYPWAKFFSLGIQLLVLVLLYQVFLGGINAREKFSILYPFIDRPDFINSNFLWFDIGKPDLFLALIVSVLLFVEISVLQSRKGVHTSGKDKAYSLIFPVATFFILYYFLTSAKSLFILTSLIFSFIIIVLQSLFWKIFKKPEKPITQIIKDTQDSGNTDIGERLM